MQKGLVFMPAQLAFGLRNGKLIHISALTKEERGENCNCTCHQCGQPLVAKMGDKRGHHFAHKTTTNCDIAHANESALHRYAKEIIQEHKRLLLPGWKITHSDLCKTSYNPHVAQQVKVALSPKYAPCFFSFKSVSIEKQIGQIVADIAVILPNKDLLVEIAVTHTVDEKKKAYIKEQDLPMIEIDLKDFLKKDLTSDSIIEDITNAVLHNPDNRKWIHNPVREKELAKKQKEFDQQYAIFNREHEEKVQKYMQKEQRKEAYKDNSKQILCELMKPENYKNEVLRLRSDRQALTWMQRFNFPENSISLNTIPFYLDIPITGEFVFKCDRRVWQGKIFEDLCKYDNFNPNYVANRLAEFKFISFDKARAYRTTINIDGYEKTVSLSSDVIKRYFDYLCLLGFVDFIYYNDAKGNRPNSLTPPNTSMAALLEDVIRSVDPYHPNVDQRIEDELRKRTPDDPIWNNPYLDFNIKKSTYYPSTTSSS